MPTHGSSCCMWPNILRLALILVLCNQLCSGSSDFNPLTPIGWIGSGISTVAKGTMAVARGTKAVIGVAASGVRGAYRLANPTQPPPVTATDDGAALKLKPPKSGYAPVGCYRDEAGNKRDLPYSGGAGRKMNKAKCSSQCAQFNAQYFGVQISLTEKGALECWCGHFYGKYGAGTKYDCQNRCPGEEEQTEEPCGGELFNSVYEIDKQ